MIRVTATEFFQKRLKPLAKKYKSLASEINALADEIQENPSLGTELGNGIRKIRLASKSKGKGKSGGFRVVTYFLEMKKDAIEIYLITIYDKSELENLTKKEIQEIVENELL